MPGKAGEGFVQARKVLDGGCISIAALSLGIAKGASEASVRIANEAVHIFGGYGYTKDFPVEKFYRDAKRCTIGEGTSAVQKLVISRELLKEG